jgi:DNA-binding CsgD family transcriptional regulator
MVIGRESELAIIRAALAGARVGESGVLVLTGEAGIGKTALLDWAGAEATGMQVLRGCGIEAEQEIPFAGLLQLLRPVLDLLDTVPGPQADALSAALAMRTAVAGDRFAVGAGTLSLIGRAAQRRPVVLLVDDAHLLDRPSADALVFAARRLLADAVVMLAAARSGEPCAFLEADLRVIGVGALGSAAAAELVAGRVSRPVPDELFDRLYRATGGNPLALLALSADLGRIDLLPPDAPVPVPDTVARAVARRTAQLDQVDRTALLTAAASGGDVAPVITALAGLGVDAAALDRLERAGLLTTAGGQVQFRHPLVRSSVYGAADPAARRRVHRMLFEALPEADMERRAWHLAASVAGPDDAAAALLDAAAARARGRSAEAIAATASERAADLSTDDAGAARRLVAAGEAAWVAGQPERARALLDRALRTSPTVLQRVRAMEVVGAVAARSGSLVEARDTLTSAATQAGGLDLDLSATLLADAVHANFYLGDSGWAMDAIAHLQQKLTAGLGLRARILALMAVGTAQVVLGSGGVDSVRASVALVTGSGEFDDDPRRLSMLVLGPLFLRESGTGRDLVRQVEQESRRRTAIGVLPSLLFHLARDDATTDQWPNAIVEYHESIRLARETGQTTELAASLAGLGWLEARQGLLDDSAAHLAESARVCEARQIHLFAAWCRFGRGDLAAGTGAVEQALSQYDGLEAHLTDHGIRDIDLAPGPERVELLLRRGRVADARKAAEAYRARAVAKGQPWAMARAERSMAQSAQDDVGGARGFAAALDWHASTLDAYERAKTLLAMGSRLRRGRKRVAAREPLGQALEIFDALGATPAATQAAIELRATGSKSQPRGASRMTRLTPQERQIATMLAGGMSTRETASALFLSPKTVEYHLRHVYTKLDVHSRPELSRLFSG